MAQYHPSNPLFHCFTLPIYSLILPPGTYDVRSYGAVSTWGEKDFPATKVKEFLSIKADPGYMGNPQGKEQLVN